MKIVMKIFGGLKYLLYLCTRIIKQSNMEEKELLYEVETTYKSGRIRSEFIAANNEDEMWADYDKHHNASLIESSVIVDCSLT